MKIRILRTLSRTGFTARLIAAVGLASLITAACDVHGISGVGSLVSMTVTPNATLPPNGTQQMVATGIDADGRAVVVSPTWSVVSGGGTISSTGLFTAGGAPGVFVNTVKATISNVSGNASITVIAGPLATIAVTPNPVTMGIGITQQFIAVGQDAAGNIVQFVPTWSVVAGGGTVAGTGVFTAGTVTGTFANTVQASSLSIKGLATVTVTPGPLASITVTPNPITLNVNLTQQFTAIGKDASGNVVALTPVWSVAAGGGTISSSGLFVAGTTLGTFTNTVTATSGALSGTATVTVTAGPLATITVTPNPVSLGIGVTQQFTAVGKDVGGNVVVISPTWAVVAGGGTINSTTGLFTAGNTTGTYVNSVRASIGGLAGFATVAVTSGSLASITVTPNPVFMQTNGTQQFIAVGKDGSGNIFLITPVWSVATGGGTIDPSTGVFIAGVVAGTFTNTITATSGVIAGTATVTVAAAAPVLTTITVSPNPVSVQANGTMQFAAVGRDGSGNIFPISPNWSVVAGGGSINAGTGLFTAGAVLGTFTNTIKATSGAISGTATVTVTAIPPVLTTITVSPNPASVPAGNTQQFGAVGRDGLGNVFSTSFVWSIDPLVGGGTIDINTGLFTAGAVAGTYTNTVRATSGAIVGKATVNVTAPPPPLVNLGTAAINGIMAGASVTCSGTGVIQASTGTANIAISPGSTMTGFPPCVFSGTTNLGDATALADQNILTAVYNTLAGLPCPAANNFGTVDYASKTLPVGVYCSASTINVTGTLTLDGGGDPNATFVFQAGSALIGAANIVLINSAQAKNVWWQVGSSATLNASAWQGNIVAFTSISLNVNSTLLGRALARNGSVTMDASHNVITLP